MSCHKPTYGSIDYEKPYILARPMWTVSQSPFGFFWIRYLSPEKMVVEILDKNYLWFSNPFDAYFWLIENVKGEII